MHPKSSPQKPAFSPADQAAAAPPLAQAGTPLHGAKAAPAPLAGPLAPAPDDASADEGSPADGEGGGIGSAALAEASADPDFAYEQSHLRLSYDTLERLARALVARMEKTRQEAAADKRAMSEEVSFNLATYDDAIETYADFSAMNRIIDGHNLAQEADSAELARIELLLKQPYFAKLVLQFKPDQPPKELYIGNAGVSDESYHRLVVDWRSPVAEVYYSQDEGPTSYVADGRIIEVRLKLRRQFDIEEDRLKAYFDTSVAIQDSLLLESLSKRRTAQMQAITATIQKEQNLVVRHEDVPALLVIGVAGSGKTSVMLQRIAYLFYKNRDRLDPSEVFLITPNPVFKHHVAGVLPDLGERNPETLTWDEFAQRLLPPDRGGGKAAVSLASLERIDAALASFDFDAGDFKDVRCAGVRLVSAEQIRKLFAKHARAAAGPHRVSLVREELYARLQARLKQMACAEETLDEVSALDADEQLRVFHEIVAPVDEAQERALALRFLNDRFADAFRAVENDEWLRIDRIGMRLLGEPGIAATAWLYLKMALTGLGDAQAKYVMIDEIQDYTAAQLAVMARYFRRARFLLLGDPNQAVSADTASLEDIRRIFSHAAGGLEECRLMTSYRSSPEITALFASLLDEEERGRVSSIQRAGAAPAILTNLDERDYREALRAALGQACDEGGLAALIVPWKHEAKRLQALLGDDAPKLVDDGDSLPEEGAVIISLKLAKGLEFDQVIVADASERAFPDDPLSRRRLYTTLSRATKRITLLSRGGLTELLAPTAGA